jgi:hypothetical protein
MWIETWVVWSVAVWSVVAYGWIVYLTVRLIQAGRRALRVRGELVKMWDGMKEGVERPTEPVVLLRITQDVLDIVRITGTKVRNTDKKG